MDRTNRMQNIVVSSLATEYVLYRKWATRRRSIHVVSVRDFCSEVCATVGIALECVEAEVDRIS